MNVFAYSLVGGVLGFGIWLVVYLSNKTSAIEFDGPATLGMLACTAIGMFIFAVFGIIKDVKKGSGDN